MRKLLLALSLASFVHAADLPFYDRTIASYTSETLPSWLKFSGEFRTRVEGRTGFGFQPDNNDGYGLFRTRINVDITPASWIEIFAQGQDAHALGLDAGRPLATFENPFDLRQAYVRLGKAKSIVKLTVGRQLLNYGAQRVIGPLDWTNTSRTFDAVKLEIGNATAKVDLFASSMVVVNPAGALDHSVAGHNLHGVYGSFSKIVPKSVFEPYVLWKTGGLSIYSAGVRLAAAPGTAGLGGFDYQVETIRQWGHVGALDRKAFSGTAMLGKSIPTLPWKARASAEYSMASGDRNPSDKTSGTFDQLYPTNHLFYGVLDIIGWQNMRQMRIGADAKPHQRLQMAVDYRWDWLDSARDSLYDATGKVSVKPKAGNTARDVGREIDFTGLWSASAQWKIGAGIGHLFPGSFLKLNSAGSSMTFPYLFAQYAF